jgi:hypothetical protein
MRPAPQEASLEHSLFGGGTHAPQLGCGAKSQLMEPAGHSVAIRQVV